MCGFAGVVTWDDRYRVSPETLAKMSAAVAHRGPDGEGAYINHQEEVSGDRPQVAMAFRRLAILDPDPRSNQPFTDGRFWLVFNGEIYNFRELRKELAGLRPEYQWRTSGDTEVLLCAFAVWGEKCVEHLNGMFAFVVWDERERSLFLARDRMGQKPLYIATPFCAPQIPAIAFGSELGVFRNLEWFEPSVKREALGEYLRWGYIGNESTIYSFADKIAPAMWARYSRGSRDGGYYFSPNDFDPACDRTSEKAREKIVLAVRRQMVSDVPLGCFLSGGVDSSIICAAMRSAALSGQAVSSFSIGFDDPRYDENAYAAAVAKHLGTHHHQFVVHPDVAMDLPKLATVYGEPFGDSSALPTHYLSKEARGHVKVALSGDGGDELFGGYDRYRAISWDRNLRRVPLSVRRFLSYAGKRFPGAANPKSRAIKLGRFLRTIDESPSQRYSGYMRLFADDLIHDLVREPIRLWDDDVAGNFETLLRDHDPAPAALATDRWTYLPDDLLTKIDRASMLHALEVRSPFMDHELVQFAAGLTTDQLLGGGPKRMLRESFAEDLPAWVFKRKKMGFAVPIGEWFRGELRGMLRETLFSSGAFGRTHFDMKVVERLVEEHERERVDHSQRLYALLMLELWWNTVKK